MTSFYASVLDCQTISRILTEKTLTNNFEAKKQTTKTVKNLLSGFTVGYRP